MKQAMSQTSVVSQSVELVAADMDGEMVMVSIENGKYYAIDAIGSKIWECIATPQTVTEVIENLMKVYDVEQQQCQADVLEFLNYLYAEGLIKLG